MTPGSDHRDQQLETTPKSNLTEMALVETGSMPAGTSGRRIESAPDQVNLALEAARADWKKREVRTHQPAWKSSLPCRKR